eukprot:206542_1
MKYIDESPEEWNNIRVDALYRSKPTVYHLQLIDAHSPIAFVMGLYPYQILSVSLDPLFGYLQTISDFVFVASILWLTQLVMVALLQSTTQSEPDAHVIVPCT